MTVTLNPQIMRSVEQLDYAVTIGDVATQAGLELNVTQQGLLALASEAGGHLQVTDSGDILYQFPKNFRTILRNRFWRLRLQELWQKIWGALFYLIRISFGVILIISIIVMFLAIVAILIAVNSKDSDSRAAIAMVVAFSSFRRIFSGFLILVLTTTVMNQGLARVNHPLHDL
jgi:fumarate reductase subunit D